ncbi:hypothetical protein B0H16DRAFT_1715475 [Mycena metata]|uniref:Uncharacterized protein n=1 Tax=Mycena metata TaxID=1033252 RepID=A0AAD7JR65_9AGAR|nr:hypothetical protein B0H16DRAFT_1715475 [Mycena metata]
MDRPKCLSGSQSSSPSPALVPPFLLPSALGCGPYTKRIIMYMVPIIPRCPPSASIWALPFFIKTITFTPWDWRPIRPRLGSIGCTRAGSPPEIYIPPQGLNAMGTVRVSHLPMSSISLFIMLSAPCGLRQVKSVGASGPPRFALAVAPPLPVNYPSYLFISPLPTPLMPQSRPIDHCLSPTAFPPDTPPPARRSALPARVFRDMSLSINRP